MRRTFYLLIGLLFISAFLGFGGQVMDSIAHVAKILFYMSIGFLLIALLLGAYHEEH